MRIPSRQSSSPPAVGCRAFTLPELMVAMALFLLLVGAVLSTSLYGLRSQAITEPRLAALEWERQFRPQLTEHIQQAMRIRIGSGDELGVTEPVAGQPRQGSALEVHLGTNTVSPTRVVYFVEGTDLKCSTNGAGPVVLAPWIAAGSVFSALVVTQNSLVTPAYAVVPAVTNSTERVTVEARLVFSRVRMGTNALPVGPAEHFTDYEMVVRATQRCN